MFHDGQYWVLLAGHAVAAGAYNRQLVNRQSTGITQVVIIYLSMSRVFAMVDIEVSLEFVVGEFKWDM